MKICVSAVASSLDAQVDPRFGRCPYLLIIDSESLEFEAISNASSGAMHGAGIQSAQTVANKGVKVVITGNMGPNAFQALSSAGIQVVKGGFGTVREMIERYRKGESTETMGPTVSGDYGMVGDRVGNNSGSQALKEKESDRMSVRLVIPTLDENGLDSQLSEHFGRAPYFTVVDLNEYGGVVNQRTIVNDSEHFGGVGLPPDRILQLKPHALITYGMGPKALAIFQDAKVAVLQTNASTVRDVVEAYNKNKLEELTEGCHEARHH